MATRQVPADAGFQLSAKYLAFMIVVFMLAYVLFHNERFLIQSTDPNWGHIETFKWYLLPHGLAGASVILLGPFQFSSRLRQRYRKAHRIVGRTYVAGAMILAPLGAYIQYFQEGMGGPRSFTVAGIIDAIMLMTTTGIAFWFIRNGKVQQHRNWMTRSYCVALVFLAVRTIGGLTGLDASSVHVETIVWTCLPLSLLVADIILQIQEVMQQSRAKAANAN